MAGAWEHGDYLQKSLSAADLGELAFYRRISGATRRPSNGLLLHGGTLYYLSSILRRKRLGLVDCLLGRLIGRLTDCLLGCQMP
jgi:hypothetical protein